MEKSITIKLWISQAGNGERIRWRPKIEFGQTIEFGLLPLSDDCDGRGWLDPVPATAALVALDLYGPDRPGLLADDLAMRLALVGLAAPLSGPQALGSQRLTANELSYFSWL